jgi:hypothetical protein
MDFWFSKTLRDVVRDREKVRRAYPVEKTLPDLPRKNSPQGMPMMKIYLCS